MNRFLPLFVLFACVGLIAGIQRFGLSLITLPLKIHDIFTVFLSVVIEATPFLLLGAGVAVLIRETTFIDRVINRIPSQAIFGLPVSAALGTILPICECGNMPIARSLVQKGLPIHYATTFLFAAPILNPAVFLSTWIAFQGQPSLIASRFILGFVVAICIGAYIFWQDRLGIHIWRPEVCSLATSRAKTHQHAHNSKRTTQILDEFTSLFPFLLVGAAFTAVFQAYVPREFFIDSNFGTATAILFMMVFAFVISVCSNTDAFLSLGFIGIVPNAAIISFLTFGAMIDTKNVLIYSRIFSLRGLVFVSILIAEIVFTLTFGMHKFGIV